MSVNAEGARVAVDRALKAYKTSPIKYYSLNTTTLDVYKQATKVFATAVTLTGRAIIRPTSEQVTSIGNGEVYDMAFLISAKEAELKFPGVASGEWVKTSGEMEWNSRRFIIDKVVPSGQVGTLYSMVIVLATSVKGHRDAP